MPACGQCNRCAYTESGAASADALKICEANRDDLSFWQYAECVQLGTVDGVKVQNYSPDSDANPQYWPGSPTAAPAPKPKPTAPKYPAPTYGPGVNLAAYRPPSEGLPTWALLAGVAALGLGFWYFTKKGR